MLTACSAPFRTTISISKPQIQKKIASHFPKKESVIVASVELDNPRVIFQTETDRIGIELDANARILDDRKSGRITVIGELRYVRESATFHLHDPEVTRVDVEGIEGDEREAVRAAADAICSAVLPEIPVHRLDGKLERAFVKSVDVRDETVLVELGL